jgi:phage gpG-like protein
MIKFNLSDVIEYSNFLKKGGGEIEKVLDDSLYRLSLGIKNSIRKQMYYDNEKPYSEISSNPNKVKFRLPKKPPIGKIRIRSGNLQSSLKVSKLENKYGYKIFLDNSKVSYAEIQELGGIIKSKGKKLAIPISEESWGKSPLKFSNTIRKGRFILKKLANGLYKPLYLLADKIKLDSREFVKYGYKNYNIDNDLNELIIKSVNLITRKR